MFKTESEEMSLYLSIREGILPSYCDRAPLVKTRYKEASGEITSLKYVNKSSGCIEKDLSTGWSDFYNYRIIKNETFLKCVLTITRGHIFSRKYCFYLLPEKNKPEESHCFKMFWVHLISRLTERSIPCLIHIRSAKWLVTSIAVHRAGLRWTHTECAEWVEECFGELLRWLWIALFVTKPELEGQ